MGQSLNGIAASQLRQPLELVQCSSTNSESITLYAATIIREAFPSRGAETNEWTKAAHYVFITVPDTPRDKENLAIGFGQQAQPGVPREGQP
jgi:hypothetical protein